MGKFKCGIRRKVKLAVSVLVAAALYGCVGMGTPRPDSGQPGGASAPENQSSCTAPATIGAQVICVVERVGVFLDWAIDLLGKVGRVKENVNTLAS